MLEPILQQLGAGNPQLAELIASNPDQFLQLLGEYADDDVPLPPGAQAISVTEEERDAIERVRFSDPNKLIMILTQSSFAVSDSTEMPRSRLTLPVIRTKSSLPTSSSTNRRTTSLLLTTRCGLGLNTMYAIYDYQWRKYNKTRHSQNNMGSHEALGP